jgi:hypothetical protein
VTTEVEGLRSKVEYRVVLLERIREKPYWWVVEKLTQMYRTPPISRSSMLIMDATGMDAVDDMMRRAGIPFKGVKFTGADDEGVSKDGRYYHIPKMTIANLLQVFFENDQLKIHRTLKLGETLRTELYNARLKRTVSGRESFDHPVGEHDDLLFATGLAAWAAKKFGATVGGTIEPDSEMPFDVPVSVPFSSAGFAGWQ